MKTSKLFFPVLFGAVGGAINAYLCYAKIPISLESKYLSFSWLIVPAGATHGAILALASLFCAYYSHSRSQLFRWLGIPVAGFLSGWLSWIPINLSFSAEKWPWVILNPFDINSIQNIFAPYKVFGLVGLIYYFLLVIFGVLYERRLWVHISCSILSGILGSLWFWIEEAWYLSILHGTIWGILVGLGTWAIQEQKNK